MTNGLEGTEENVQSEHRLSGGARQIDVLLSTYFTSRVNASVVTGVRKDGDTITLYFPMLYGHEILPIIKKALSHPDSLTSEDIAGGNRIEALEKNVNCHTSAVSFTFTEPDALKIARGLERMVSRSAAR